MKKLSFELIRRIDFVLVFVLAVIAILVLVVEFVQDLIPIRSMPNQIPVVENHDVEIKEYLKGQLWQ